jgi:FixJ family two-component response regulator
MRRALARLMKSAGIEAATFSSAHEFLGDFSKQVDCAVTNLQMPGLDGLWLQEENSLRRCPILPRWFSSPATATFQAVLKR